MGVLRIISISFITLLGTQAMAQGCPDFTGEYANFSDSERPKIRVSQQGCESIKFIDKENVEWTIPLNGVPAKVPADFERKVDPLVSQSEISGSFSQNSDIQLVVHTHMNLPLVPGRGPIEVEVEGRAHAMRSAKNIDLVFDEIKILSIVNGRGLIANGENSGFIQGANWVIDMAKSTLDIRLKEI